MERNVAVLKTDWIRFFILYEKLLYCGLFTLLKEARIENEKGFLVFLEKGKGVPFKKETAFGIASIDD